MITAGRWLSTEGGVWIRLREVRAIRLGRVAGRDGITVQVYAPSVFERWLVVGAYPSDAKAAAAVALLSETIDRWTVAE